MLSPQQLHHALKVLSGTLIGLIGAMRRFFANNYHWSESCFIPGEASISAEKVEAMILDGMSRFIPSSTKSFSPQNPFFDGNCSLALRVKDNVYREWKNSPSPITLANFHSARNRCRDVLLRTKRTFTKRKCADLHTSPTD